MRPLIVLTGPTAVGKTALSVELAKRVGGEILSADSMQVYRGMDIGSAKIKPQETQGVPHHLIDVLDPDQEFNVTVFQKLCKQAMEGVYERGRIPILTGGTGFYIQAVLRDIDFTENPEDTEYRRQLEQLAAERGGLALHEMLAEADPEAALAIHAHNIKRMIRALEFHHFTGRKISEHNEQEARRPSPYRFCYFVLSDERDRLYRRIEERVDRMLEEGLEEEVRGLMERGCTRDMVSMQGLGYKEMLDYLSGETTLEEAVRRIKQGTRHFAKRQLTWFRRERDVIWLNRPDYGDDEERILEAMERCLRKAGILPASGK